MLLLVNNVQRTNEATNSLFPLHCRQPVWLSHCSRSLTRTSFLGLGTKPIFHRKMIQLGWGTHWSWRFCCFISYKWIGWLFILSLLKNLERTYFIAPLYSERLPVNQSHHSIQMFTGFLRSRLNLPLFISHNFFWCSMHNARWYHRFHNFHRINISLSLSPCLLVS